MFIIVLIISIAVEDLHLIIRRGDVGWDPNNRFNPASFLCLDLAFYRICRSFFVSHELKQEVVTRFVNIDGIVDYHYMFI